MTVRGKRRRNTPAASVTGTYVVCLDCGQEFPYDWNEMRMISTKPQNSEAPQPVTILPGHKAA